ANIVASFCCVADQIGERLGYTLQNRDGRRLARGAACLSFVCSCDSCCATGAYVRIRSCSAGFEAVPQPGLVALLTCVPSLSGAAGWRSALRRRAPHVLGRRGPVAPFEFAGEVSLTLVPQRLCHVAYLRIPHQ